MKFLEFLSGAEKKEPVREKDTLHWFFLGGNNKGRIGANCGLAVYEHTTEEGDRHKHSLLFDLGSMFGDNGAPEDDALAQCDTIIPDITDKLKKRGTDTKTDADSGDCIDAIFLTHSHFDHIDAIPYLILMGYEMPPIYATPFTAKRLYQSLNNQNIPAEEWPKVTEIASGQTIEEGPFKVTGFSVSHSTPQSVGFYIETPEGNILNPGDFKLDPTILWGPGFNQEQFDSIVSNGVDLLLLDSTGGGKENEQILEHDVRETLRDLKKKHPDRRFVVTTMGGFEENMASVAKVAAEHDCTLWVAGWSHEQALSALSQTGLSLSDHIGQKVEVKTVTSGKRVQEEFTRAKPEDTFVLTTGAQGERNALLSIAADGKSALLKLNKNKDIILFCAPTIPGREGSKEALVSNLRKKGYTVFTHKDLKLYAQAHARQPELIKMAILSNPKTIVPIHGSQKLRDANDAALTANGFKTLSVKNGEAVRVTKDDVALEPAFTRIPKLIGLRTLTGRHWQDRDYMAIFAPRDQEKLKTDTPANNNAKRRPQIFKLK